MGKSLGIILIVLGLIMLVWGGFIYTKQEKIVDAGPIQISADKQKTVNWPPYAGAVALIAGVVIFASAKKRA